MSERKVAPVLAGMAPERAREVTEELAVLRKLRAEKRRMAEQ
jgi:flagellar motility protein MotE (MotC chaperone)